MKKFILLVFIALTSGIARTQAQEQKIVCGDAAGWQQATSIDPSLVQKREEAVAQMEQYLKAHASARTTSGDSANVRIIPVVCHVIHDGGPENIPDSQIVDAIRIFNEDFRRLNNDASQTYAAFQPVGADCNIEFRLATLDPNGNCTNGINRVYSHFTEKFDDFGKAIIDWPSNKYLNIWIVKNIGFSTEGTGHVIGYAQFPLRGASATDGVVLQHDFVGTVGTGLTGNPKPADYYKGRNGTHEIGHWLDLIHIWGNCADNVSCCGDDRCSDTPTQDHANFHCPMYPQITCSNNGDMSQNYMDYSDGSCKNIFTKDQKARMDATLAGARHGIWQASNLAATGVAYNYTYPTNACAPKADFIPVHQNICAGSTIIFHADSYHYLTGGAATSWNWSFPGGTPPSSTDSIPVVTYNTGGAYSVTLTVSNASGSTTITRDNVAVVDYGTGQNALPYSQNFENTLPSDWVFFNDDGGYGWQRTNRAASSGSYSLSVQNFNTYSTSAPGSIKEFYTPSYDFTGIAHPLLSFRLSYGHQYSQNLDSLSIRASIDCGKTFPELKHLSSAVLAAGSGGFQPMDFVPSANQWLLVQIQLPGTYANKKNVKFSFQYIADVLSNNIYIDDINVADGYVGINEVENNLFSFNAYPIPAKASFTVSYTLRRAEDLAINLYDLQGRLVRQIENKHATAGNYEMKVDAKSFDLTSGVYLVKMATSDGVISKKIIYSTP